eukprot:COSAG04_NODE_3223_length_3031_cov_2.873806_4_plen_103_part_00
MTACEMRHGLHSAKFTVIKQDSSATVGVVGPGFDPSGGSKAFSSVSPGAGWVIYLEDGKLYTKTNGATWAGQLQKGEIKAGDVLGLVADLSVGRCAQQCSRC